MVVGVGEGASQGVVMVDGVIQKLVVEGYHNWLLMVDKVYIW